jgi:hypothetical protein
MLLRTVNVLLLCLSAMFAAASLSAADPAPLLTCQGRLTTSGQTASGNHVFTFSIINPDSSVAWTASAITLPVNDGLYAVVLGDTTVAGMPAIPAGILTTSGLSLRITADAQLLSPDVALIPAVQANLAFHVANGVIGSAQLDPTLGAQLTPKARIIAPAAWNGSLTIASSDANGEVVALCGNQSKTSPPVVITFPSASSFPAGGVVRLRFHATSTSSPVVNYVLQGSDTLTVDQTIYQTAAGSPALVAASNVLPPTVAFVSDGAAAWYQVP